MTVQSSQQLPCSGLSFTGGQDLYSTVLSTELCLPGFGNERINEQMTQGEVEGLERRREAYLSYTEGPGRRGFPSGHRVSAVFRTPIHPPGLQAQCLSHRPTCTGRGHSWFYFGNLVMPLTSASPAPHMAGHTLAECQLNWTSAFHLCSELVKPLRISHLWTPQA